MHSKLQMAASVESGVSQMRSLLGSTRRVDQKRRLIARRCAGCGCELLVGFANSMTTHATVRSYRSEDRQALDAFWTVVFPDDPPWNKPSLLLDAKLLIQPELVLVAVVEGRVVGAIMAGFDGVQAEPVSIPNRTDFATMVRATANAVMTSSRRSRATARVSLWDDGDVWLHLLQAWELYATISSPAGRESARIQPMKKAGARTQLAGAGPAHRTASWKAGTRRRAHPGAVRRARVPSPLSPTSDQAMGHGCLRGPLCQLLWRPSQ